jgi:predicted nucleic acid-binding protein
VHSGPVLLDTDTLSELCRGNERVVDRARSYLKTHGRLTTTAVTVFERLRGYEMAIQQGKPFDRQLQSFRGLAAACVVLPFDDEAAAVASKIWGRAVRSLRQKLGDLLIASVAISRQLPLVTRNRRDFEALAAAGRFDLHLVDWTRAEARRSR